MIEGAKWRRCAFYIPLGVFIFGLLFPFYWMLVTAFRPELLSSIARGWRPITRRSGRCPTFDHIIYLLSETLFSRSMLNTLIIRSRPRRSRCSAPATAATRCRGSVPVRRQPRSRHLRIVPTSCPSPSSRSPISYATFSAIRPRPLSSLLRLPDSVLHSLLMGCSRRSPGARGDVRASTARRAGRRWCSIVPDGSAGILSAGIFASRCRVNMIFARLPLLT